MDHRYEDISDCEVDHSFFDSDFEEEVKKNGNTAKIDEEDSGEIPQTEDRFESNPNLNIETKVVESAWAKEERQENEAELQKEDTLGSSEAELQKQDTLGSGEVEFQKEDTLGSGVHQPQDAASFLASLNLENASTSGRNSAQSRRMHERNIPTHVPQMDKKCEENYYTDEEDSSDDSRNQKVRLKLSKQSSYAKVSKNIAVAPSSSSSSSSPSCSSDTDCSDTDSDGCLSDSSCSSSKKNSMYSLALLSPKQKSIPGIKSVEVKPRLGDYAEESEDTVTDVTPLSTPDISPIQSFEVAASNDKKLKVKRQENVSQELYEPDQDHKCHQKVLNEAVDLNNLLKAFLQLEKKEQQKLVLDQSSLVGSRKNYSFTNEEVRQIDRENQRLLKELTKHATKPRSKSSSVKKPSGPTTKMYHSAINRQREQQRIDRENLAFLKRLEAVKPTVGMRRSEQLLDYQRQMSYLSATPTPRRGKSAISHHSPSRGASRASSHSASSTMSRRSERPVFDSSSGALQRLNPSNIRGAWL